MFTSFRTVVHSCLFWLCVHNTSNSRIYSATGVEIRLYCTLWRIHGVQGAPYRITQITHNFFKHSKYVQFLYVPVQMLTLFGRGGSRRKFMRLIPSLFENATNPLSVCPLRTEKPGSTTVSPEAGVV